MAEMKIRNLPPYVLWKKGLKEHSSSYTRTYLLLQLQVRKSGPHGRIEPHVSHALPAHIIAHTRSLIALVRATRARNRRLSKATFLPLGLSCERTPQPELTRRRRLDTTASLLLLRSLSAARCRPCPRLASPFSLDGHFISHSHFVAPVGFLL